MRAQVYGQALIYIFTLVLVSIILVYGYNAISNFRTRAVQVSFLEFKNEITNSFKGLASEYGSFRNVEFSLPQGIKKVCFADTYDVDIKNYQQDTDNNAVDPIIVDIIKPYEDRENRLDMKSIFLIDNNVRDSFKMDVKIDVPPIIKANGVANNNDVLCKTAVGGRINLNIEGKGDGVKIS